MALRLGISRLKNRVQEYAWGSKTAIPELFGEPSPARNPKAELWMGTHSRAPSSVIINSRPVSLAGLIRKNPVEILGEKTAARFSGSLPFLFKVLAAARPLSIQAHPNLVQAEQGFALENERHIPLDAFNRSYKDPNHKPEILSALTPFWALNGFRPAGEILSILEAMAVKSIGKELYLLRANPNKDGLRAFFHSLMTLPAGNRMQAVKEAATRAEGCHGPVYDWIVKLNQIYPGDIGVLCPTLLNLVCLNPGETMFLDAGELHAYLEGVGIELMANSDNVLRGGLTKKHIDLPELLKILNFKGRPLKLVQEKLLPSGEKLFLSPAREFLLAEIRVDGGHEYSSSRQRSVEIMINIEGNALIHDQGSNEELALARGDSLLIPASVEQYLIKGNARIYRASVPF